ncbi:Nuclear factor interleukin-3-regulated protein [Oryzias melastigma]|uniref:Nuclear factor interleukin-3-regulated protein n=1 Tax=Oryzias melastigma TaxID=30732 RepID=A0A834BV82_ORYME|nr:Nuclear factor interleukin-3-regulated protein [Oryzias melastigma]
MFDEGCQEQQDSPAAGGGGGGAAPLSFTDDTVSVLTSSNLLARSLLGRTSASKRKESPGSCNRRKREFIPHEKKDEGYWDKRRKNNEAAKRSREKRRVNDMVLESQVLALLEENARLRAELLALKFRFGLVKDPSNTPILPLTAAPQTLTPHYYLHKEEESVQSSSAPHPSSTQSSARTSREPAHASEDSGFSTPGGSSVGSPVFFEDRLADHEKFYPHRGEELGYDLHHSPPDAHHNAELSGGRLDQAEAMKNLPHKLRFKIPGSGEAAEADCARRSPTFSAAGRGAKGTSGGEAGPAPCSWLQQLEGEESKKEKQSPHYQGSAACYNLHSTPTQGQSEVPNENSFLKTQLSSLSEEVAQLKKLFTEQLMAKTN